MDGEKKKKKKIRNGNEDGGWVLSVDQRNCEKNSRCAVFVTTGIFHRFSSRCLRLLFMSVA